mmetsp:Transcript_34587/g.77949  ORF Transcript_34587/g.77949 Transcript_34587/m.77949 type:complete len:114 (-) Transcript_34587:133-474(-)
MLQSIMLSSVLDRPVCSRRERRKVDGELLHHHVYKRLLSGSSSSAVCETSLPDFLYLDLSSSSSDDTKKTLQPRRQRRKTGDNNERDLKSGGLASTSVTIPAHAVWREGLDLR